MGKTWCRSIVLNDIKALNERDIEEKLNHANLWVITRKYPSKYRKHRHELVDEPKKHPNRMFLHENLAIQIIKDRRTESDNFRTDFGFNVLDVFNVKQQTITKIIKDAFEGEDIRTEYNVLSFSVDLYF